MVHGGSALWQPLERIIGSALILCAALAAGCYFDSGIPWRQGPYALLWIDDPDHVRLSIDRGQGSWQRVVDWTVFAVGANERYIVAKQHPGGNKSTTNYFIVDIAKASLASDIEAVVVGPLTAEQFKEKSEELKLPPFSKVLKSLE